MINEKNYREAIFWFELALAIKPNPESGAFILTDCYGYIPAIWLCVCYDRLGEYDRAYEYNELAPSLKPESEAALLNKRYFEESGLLKNTH